MSKKENQSITYIYDEMDPSEKLEFERDLEKDNNLLIEVESFKKIAEKLDRLNTIEPPAELTAAIYDKATSLRRSPTAFYPGRYMFAAAALVLISFSFGMFIFDSQDSATTDQSDAAAIGSNTLITQPGSADHALRVSSENEKKRVTPWVDQNEVIHFYDRLGTGDTASVDSIFRHSFQKLNPVTDPAQSKTIQRHLHLTGGNR